MSEPHNTASDPAAPARAGAKPRPNGMTASSATGAGMGKGTIGLWRGDDRCENLRRAMALVMDDIDWRTRRRVVVKPNLVTPEIPLSVTHPQALDTVLSQIRRRYDGPLAVAEGCALTPTPEAFADLGFDKLARAHGADLVDLNTDEAVGLSVYDRRGRPLELRMARTLLDSDCLVSLSVPKTHDTVLVTLRDGSQVVHEIDGSWGVDVTDPAAMRRALRAVGVNAVEVVLYGGKLSSNQQQAPPSRGGRSLTGPQRAWARPCSGTLPPAR